MNSKTIKKIRVLLESVLKKQAAMALFSFLVKRFAFLALGPWAWLFGLLFDFGWNLVGHKALNYLERKGALAVDMSNGKVIAKKITKTRNEGTEEEYNEAVNDIFR